MGRRRCIFLSKSCVSAEWVWWFREITPPVKTETAIWWVFRRRGKYKFTTVRARLIMREVGNRGRTNRNSWARQGQGICKELVNCTGVLFPLFGAQKKSNGSGSGVQCNLIRRHE